MCEKKCTEMYQSSKLMWTHLPREARKKLTLSAWSLFIKPRQQACWPTLLFRMACSRQWGAISITTAFLGTCCSPSCKRIYYTWVQYHIASSLSCKWIYNSSVQYRIASGTSCKWIYNSSVQYHIASGTSCKWIYNSSVQYCIASSLSCKWIYNSSVQYHMFSLLFSFNLRCHSPGKCPYVLQPIFCALHYRQCLESADMTNIWQFMLPFLQILTVFL